MSAALPIHLRRVIERIGSVQSVDAATAGQSGADVWRVTTLTGRYAVRRWPPGVTLQRVQEVEHFMRHLHSRGLEVIPAPCDVGGSMPSIDPQNRAWNVETWMDGSPVADEPVGAVRLQEAIELLAAIHRQSRELGVHHQVPLAVRRRAGRLAELPQALSALQRRTARVPSLAAAVEEVRQYADLHLDRLTAAYDALARQPRPCWMVLRDVHRQHVLYQGQQLTGLIDFDAVRVDTPMADLARLLGSLLATDAEAYRSAVREYFSPAPPDAPQLRLVDLLDEATTLCAAVYWLETLSESEDTHGWQLLSWHTMRLRQFPFGWSWTEPGGYV